MCLILVVLAETILQMRAALEGSASHSSVLRRTALTL